MRHAWLVHGCLISSLILMPIGRMGHAEEGDGIFYQTSSESYVEVQVTAPEGTTGLVPGTNRQVAIKVLQHSWEIWTNSVSGITETRSQQVTPIGASLSYSIPTGNGSAYPSFGYSNYMGEATTSFIAGNVAAASTLVVSASYGGVIATGSIDFSAPETEVWSFNHTESLLSATVVTLGTPENLASGDTRQVQANVELSTWSIWTSNEGHTQTRDYSTSPAAGASVNWSITGGDGACLSATSTMSESNGNAYITFMMGESTSVLRADMSYAGSNSTYATLTFMPMAEEWYFNHNESIVSDVTLSVTNGGSSDGLQYGEQRSLITTANLTTWDVWISNMNHTENRNTQTIYSCPVSNDFAVDYGDGSIAGQDGLGHTIFQMGSQPSRLRVTASSNGTSGTATLDFSPLVEVWQYSTIGNTYSLALTTDGSLEVDSSTTREMTATLANTQSDVWVSNLGNTDYRNPRIGPVDGVNIAFSIQQGDGMLSAASAITDSLGQAKVSFTMGSYDSIIVANNPDLGGTMVPATITLRQVPGNWTYSHDEGVITTHVTTSDTTTELHPNIERSVNVQVLLTTWQVWTSDLGTNKFINEATGPANNAAVVLSVETGNGLISQQSANTDANGDVTAIFTMGTQDSRVRADASYAAATSVGTLDFNRAEWIFDHQESALELQLAPHPEYEAVNLFVSLDTWDVWTNATGQSRIQNSDSSPAINASVAFTISDPNSSLGNPNLTTDSNGAASTDYLVYGQDVLSATVSFLDLTQTVTLGVRPDGSWYEKSQLTTGLSLSGNSLSASVTYDTWKERYNERWHCIQTKNFESRPVENASLSWGVTMGNAIIKTCTASTNSSGSGTATLKAGSNPSTVQVSASAEGYNSAASSPVEVPAGPPPEQPIIQSRSVFAITTGGHHDYIQGTWVYSEGHVTGPGGGTGTPADWSLCPGFDANGPFPTRATAAADYRGWIGENWPLPTEGSWSDSDGNTGSVAGIGGARAVLTFGDQAWKEMGPDTVNSTLIEGPFSSGCPDLFASKPVQTPSDTFPNYVTVSRESGTRANFNGGIIEVRIARPPNSDTSESLSMTFHKYTWDSDSSGMTDEEKTLTISEGATESSETITLYAATTTNGQTHTESLSARPPAPQVEVNVNDTADENDDMVRKEQIISSQAWRQWIPCTVKIPNAQITSIGVTAESGTMKFSSAQAKPGDSDSGEANVTVTLDAQGQGKFWITGITQSANKGSAKLQIRKNGVAGDVLATQPMTVFWFDATITFPGQSVASKAGILYGITNTQYAWTFSGEATIKPAGLDSTAPQIANMRLGFVQNVKTTRNWQVNNPSIQAGSAAPASSTVTVASTRIGTVTWQDYVLDTRPQTLWTPFYHVVASFDSGGKSLINNDDSPQAPADDHSKPAQAIEGNQTWPVTVEYKWEKTVIQDDFLLWLGVADADNTGLLPIPPSVVPIRQVDWKFHADSSASGLQMPTGGTHKAPDTVPLVTGQTANKRGANPANYQWQDGNQNTNLHP